MQLARTGGPPWGAGAILLLVFSFQATLSAAGLRLRALEGNGMVVAPSSVSSRRIVVVAEDESGQAVPGATVRFRLPASGSSGHFASGMTSETVWLVER